MPIQGIFYARFLPQEGTKIVAQSPPGCIVPVAVADESDDDDFDERPAAEAEAEAIASRDDAANSADDEGGESAENATTTDDDTEDEEEQDDEATAKAAAAAAASALLGTGTGASSTGGGSRSSRKGGRLSGQRGSGSTATGTGTGTGGLGASMASFGRKTRGATATAAMSGSLPRTKTTILDFDVMQDYVIPRPAFFNRFLAAQDPSGRYTVLGFPVAIRDAKYDRNEFIFNFGIVVDVRDDQGPYEGVVRRLASTFAEMEKQNAFLSQEEMRAQRGRGGGMSAGGTLGESLLAGVRASPAGTTPATGGGGDTPSFHAMAGVMGNNQAMSSIGEFLDRRRTAGQSPQLGPQGAGAGRSGSSACSAPTIAAAMSTANAMSGSTHDIHGHSPYHRRSIQTLLEIIKEDLNLYGECMIPVDDANTINMKLFPLHANPPAVEGWHVPVPKMRLADTVDPTWDLTLQRVIAHMDGVSDVRRIAFEADISMELCRSALRHLLYYDTILLLDMFFFSSCYAPRPGIHDFVANVGGIVDECARYVCLGRQDRDAGDGGRERRAGSTSAGSGSQHRRRRRESSSRQQHHQRGKGKGKEPDDGTSDRDSDDSEEEDSDDGDDHHHHRHDTHARFSSPSPSPSSPSSPSAASSATAAHGENHRPVRVSNFDLIRLMTSFCVGRTVTEWLKGHSDAGFDVLRYVDVRRLVQFGVIKGCLYRVHKYVVSKQYLASLVTGRSSSSSSAAAAAAPAGGAEKPVDPLQKYVDGQHPFDQIITEQNLTDVELIKRLKRLPLPSHDLKILYR